MNALGPILSGLTASLFSPILIAAEQATGDPLNGATGLIKVVVALALILAMIFALGWFMRRFGMPGRGKGSGLLQTIDSTHLGARERVVLLAVGDRQILVGITPAGMTRLGEFAAAKGSDVFSDTLSKIKETDLKK